jgi:hypothetical protein
MEPSTSCPSRAERAETFSTRIMLRAAPKKQRHPDGNLLRRTAEPMSRSKDTPFCAPE